eukprot:scaffold79437_cov22-Tisochrysis_lutea.AAC.2
MGKVDLDALEALSRQHQAVPTYVVPELRLSMHPIRQCAHAHTNGQYEQGCIVSASCAKNRPRMDMQ